MKKKTGIPKLIEIGFISKPHGFKGELIFAIEKGYPEEYAETDFFWIELEGNPVPFFVDEIRVNGSGMIVKLEDVNTETEARIISGKKISVDQSTTDSVEDEITWDSLIGYTVFDEAHGKLGVLEGIEEYPQQVIARCTVNEKEVLFPLHEDLILEIDDEKKELHIQLPEGLLDLYLK